MPFAKRLSSAEHRFEIFLTLLLGFALVSFVLFRFHSGTDFSFGNSGQIYMSQATAEGVDIAARTHFYRDILVAGSLLLLVFFLILNVLSRKAGIRFSRFPDLALMAAALIATAFLGSMGVSVKLTTELLATLFSWRIVSIFIQPHISADFRLNEFGLNTALALNLLAGTWFVIGGASLVVNIALWLTLFLIAVPVIQFGLKRLLKSAELASSSLMIFFAVPWCIFLASEYSFWKYEKYGTAAAPVAVFLLLFLVSAILLYVLVLQKPASEKKRRFLQRWMASSLLFLFTLIVYYVPVNSDVTDLFETANSANSVMCVFRFHEIPVVDFISSHMLSEQWYGYLYSAIFGYRSNLELLSYVFLNEFIYLLVAYIFLKKVFKNLWTTLFVVCFLPVLNETIFPPIFFSVISFMAIVQAYKDPSVKNYLVTFFTIVGLIIWRIDTGVVAVMAGGLLFALLGLWLKQKIAWRKLFLSVGIFVGFLALCFSLAVVITGKTKIVERISLFLHYISAEQAHGYAALSHTEAHQFYLIHVAIPAAAILLIFYILLLLKQIPREKILSSGYLLLASLFLFLVFLFNAPRGLVRHGFPENAERFFWSTFIPAVALFLVYFVRSYRKRYLPAIWFSVVFGFFFCFKYFSWIPEQTPLESGIRNASVFHMKWWSQDPYLMSHRFLKNDSIATASAGNIRVKMNSILTDKQTFFDFSNAPLLYFFTDRAVPGFFCQNLQNTVDDKMQLQLISELPVHKVPAVVYSAVPSTWYDETDGIHNTVRYYLIAEYIHANYYYFCTADGRAIWLANHLATKYVPSKYAHAPKILNLNLLPANVFSIVSHNKKDYPVKALGTFSRANDMELKVPDEVHQQRHVWMSVEIAGHQANRTSMQLIAQDGDTLTMNFTLKEGQQKYLFRLTNNYIWWLPGDLRILFPENGGLKRLTFYHDERFEN